MDHHDAMMFGAAWIGFYYGLQEHKRGNEVWSAAVFVMTLTMFLMCWTTFVLDAHGR